MPNQLHHLFPPGVIALGAPTEYWRGELHPAEAEIITHAAAKRRLQFTAGRICAHEALRHLGIHGLPVLRAKDGEPVWPSGTVGSIAHCDDYCTVAVARSQDFSGLGIDVEPAAPIEGDLAKLICTPDEFTAIDGFSRDNQHLRTKLVFCAKESVYKCIYPMTKLFLDFKDIRISLEDVPGRFRAELLGPQVALPHGSRVLLGRYLVTPTHIFTATALRTRE